jgi:type II secretory pathway component PulF
MTRFRYTAVDASGQPVSGELDAPDKDQALAQLAGQGLGSAAVEPLRPPAAWMGRLSASEAAELSSRIAGLAKAGLPLGPGLRAMANELDRPSVARVLRAMADRLEAGESFESVMVSQGRALPEHVRGLVLAGIRSGRLGEAMEEYVLIDRARADLRRRMWTASVYPLILLSLMIVIFIFFMAVVVPPFSKIFDDFGLALPKLTVVIVDLARWGIGWWIVVIFAGCLALVLSLGAVSRPALARDLFYRVPLVGPTWYWARMAWFARLMRMLLNQQVPLPQALELAADGVNDAALAHTCRWLAAQVEKGVPLSEALRRSWRLPAMLRPLARIGERSGSLGPAFQAATEMFQANAEVRARLLQTTFAPVVFLVLAVGVSLMVIALFMPLISLISNLSGGKS